MSLNSVQDLAKAFVRAITLSGSPTPNASMNFTVESFGDSFLHDVIEKKQIPADVFKKIRDIFVTCVYASSYCFGLAKDTKTSEQLAQVTFSACTLNFYYQALILFLQKVELFNTEVYKNLEACLPNPNLEDVYASSVYAYLNFMKSISIFHSSIELDSSFIPPSYQLSGVKEHMEPIYSEIDALVKEAEAIRGEGKVTNISRLASSIDNLNSHVSQLIFTISSLRSRLIENISPLYPEEPYLAFQEYSQRLANTLNLIAVLSVRVVSFNSSVFANFVEILYQIVQRMALTLARTSSLLRFSGKLNEFTNEAKLAQTEISSLIPQLLQLLVQAVQFDSDNHSPVPEPLRTFCEGEGSEMFDLFRDLIQLNAEFNTQFETLMAAMRLDRRFAIFQKIDLDFSSKITEAALPSIEATAKLAVQLLASGDSVEGLYTFISQMTKKYTDFVNFLNQSQEIFKDYKFEIQLITENMTKFAEVYQKYATVPANPALRMKSGILASNTMDAFCSLNVHQSMFRPLGDVRLALSESVVTFPGDNIAQVLVPIANIQKNVEALPENPRKLFKVLNKLFNDTKKDSMKIIMENQNIGDPKHVINCLRECDRLQIYLSSFVIVLKQPNVPKSFANDIELLEHYAFVIKNVALSFRLLLQDNYKHGAAMAANLIPPFIQIIDSIAAQQPDVFYSKFQQCKEGLQTGIDLINSQLVLKFPPGIYCQPMLLEIYKGALITFEKILSLLKMCQPIISLAPDQKTIKTGMTLITQAVQILSQLNPFVQHVFREFKLDIPELAALVLQESINEMEKAKNDLLKAIKSGAKDNEIAKLGMKYIQSIYDYADACGLTPETAPLAEEARDYALKVAQMLRQSDIDPEALQQLMKSLDANVAKSKAVAAQLLKDIEKLGQTDPKAQFKELLDEMKKRIDYSEAILRPILQNSLADILKNIDVIQNPQSTPSQQEEAKKKIDAEKENIIMGSHLRGKPVSGATLEQLLQKFASESPDKQEDDAQKILMVIKKLLPDLLEGKQLDQLSQLVDNISKILLKSKPRCAAAAETLGKCFLHDPNQILAQCLAEKDKVGPIITAQKLWVLEKVASILANNNGQIDPLLEEVIKALNDNDPKKANELFNQYLKEQEEKKKKASRKKDDDEFSYLDIYPDIEKGLPEFSQIILDQVPNPETMAQLRAGVQSSVNPLILPLVNGILDHLEAVSAKFQYIIKLLVQDQSNSDLQTEIKICYAEVVADKAVIQKAVTFDMKAATKEFIEELFYQLEPQTQREKTCNCGEMLLNTYAHYVRTSKEQNLIPEPSLLNYFVVIAADTTPERGFKAMGAVKTYLTSPPLNAFTKYIHKLIDSLKEKNLPQVREDWSNSHASQQVLESVIGNPLILIDVPNSLENQIHNLIMSLTPKHDASHYEAIIPLVVELLRKEIARFNKGLSELAKINDKVNRLMKPIDVNDPKQVLAQMVKELGYQKGGKQIKVEANLEDLESNLIPFEKVDMKNMYTIDDLHKIAKAIPTMPNQFLHSVLLDTVKEMENLTQGLNTALKTPKPNEQQIKKIRHEYTKLNAYKNALDFGLQFNPQICTIDNLKAVAAQLKSQTLAAVVREAPQVALLTLGTIQNQKDKLDDQTKNELTKLINTTFKDIPDKSPEKQALSAGKIEAIGETFSEIDNLQNQLLIREALKEKAKEATYKGDAFGTKLALEQFLASDATSAILLGMDLDSVNALRSTPGTIENLLQVAANSITTPIIDENLLKAISGVFDRLGDEKTNADTLIALKLQSQGLDQGSKGGLLSFSKDQEADKELIKTVKYQPLLAGDVSKIDNSVKPDELPQFADVKLDQLYTVDQLNQIQQNIPPSSYSNILKAYVELMKAKTVDINALVAVLTELSKNPKAYPNIKQNDVVVAIQEHYAIITSLKSSLEQAIQFDNSKATLENLKIVYQSYTPLSSFKKVPISSILYLIAFEVMTNSGYPPFAIRKLDTSLCQIIAKDKTLTITIADAEVLASILLEPTPDKDIQRLRTYCTAAQAALDPDNSENSNSGNTVNSTNVSASNMTEAIVSTRKLLAAQEFREIFSNSPVSLLKQPGTIENQLYSLLESIQLYTDTAVIENLRMLLARYLSERLNAIPSPEVIQTIKSPLYNIGVENAIDQNKIIEEAENILKSSQKSVQNAKKELKPLVTFFQKNLEKDIKELKDLRQKKSSAKNIVEEEEFQRKEAELIGKISQNASALSFLDKLDSVDPAVTNAVHEFYSKLSDPVKAGLASKVLLILANKSKDQKVLDEILNAAKEGYENPAKGAVITEAIAKVDESDAKAATLHYIREFKQNVADKDCKKAVNSLQKIITTAKLAGSTAEAAKLNEALKEIEKIVAEHPDAYQNPQFQKLILDKLNAIMPIIDKIEANAKALSKNSAQAAALIEKLPKSEDIDNLFMEVMQSKSSKPMKVIMNTLIEAMKNDIEDAHTEADPQNPQIDIGKLESIVKRCDSTKTAIKAALKVANDKNKAHFTLEDLEKALNDYTEAKPEEKIALLPAFSLDLTAINQRNPQMTNVISNVAKNMSKSPKVAAAQYEVIAQVSQKPLADLFEEEYAKNGFKPEKKDQKPKSDKIKDFNRYTNPVDIGLVLAEEIKANLKKGDKKKAEELIPKLMVCDTLVHVNAGSSYDEEEQKRITSALDAKSGLDLKSQIALLDNFKNSLLKNEVDSEQIITDPSGTVLDRSANFTNSIYSLSQTMKAKESSTADVSDSVKDVLNDAFDTAQATLLASSSRVKYDPKLSDSIEDTVIDLLTDITSFSNSATNAVSSQNKGVALREMTKGSRKVTESLGELSEKADSLSNTTGDAEMDKSDYRVCTNSILGTLLGISKASALPNSHAKKLRLELLQKQLDSNVDNLESALNKIKADQPDSAPEINELITSLKTTMTAFDKLVTDQINSQSVNDKDNDKENEKNKDKINLGIDLAKVREVALVISNIRKKCNDITSSDVIANPLIAASLPVRFRIPQENQETKDDVKKAVSNANEKLSALLALLSNKKSDPHKIKDAVIEFENSVDNVYRAVRSVSRDVWSEETQERMRDALSQLVTTGDRAIQAARARLLGLDNWPALVKTFGEVAEKSLRNAENTSQAAIEEAKRQNSITDTALKALVEAQKSLQASKVQLENVKGKAKAKASAEDNTFNVGLDLVDVEEPLLKTVPRLAAAIGNQAKSVLVKNDPLLGQITRIAEAIKKIVNGTDKTVDSDGKNIPEIAKAADELKKVSAEIVNTLDEKNHSGQNAANLAKMAYAIDQQAAQLKAFIDTAQNIGQGVKSNINVGKGAATKADAEADLSTKKNSLLEMLNAEAMVVENRRQLRIAQRRLDSIVDTKV